MSQSLAKTQFHRAVLNALAIALVVLVLGCFDLAYGQPAIPPSPPSCDHWAGYGVGGLNGNWSVPSNWLLGVVPTSFYDACIQNGISNVTLDVSATVQRLWIDPSNVLNSVPGVTLTIAGGRNPALISNDGLIVMNSSTLAFSANATLGTPPPATDATAQ